MPHVAEPKAEPKPTFIRIRLHEGEEGTSRPGGATITRIPPRGAQGSRALFWSRRGEVACTDHAPPAGTDRWQEDRWQILPPGALDRPQYQCQQCSRDVQRQEVRPAGVPLILNVDDHQASLYARHRILRLHGFQVVNVRTAHEAMAMASETPPSLILLDVHLPDGDGRDLCREFKADARLATVPVVLISAALSGAANQLDAVRVGEADGFIAEPVNPAALVSTLRQVLST